MTGLRYRGADLARECFFIVMAIVWCVPFYYLVIVALKPDLEVFTRPMDLPSELVWANFPRAWQGSAGGHIGSAFVSSLIVTVGAVGLLILIGAVTAYVVARNTRYGDWLYMFFVAGYILPFQLAIVPVYTAFRSLGLVGNHIGLVLLFTGLLMPMSVFLYSGFVRSLPKDYEEAAEVDGASSLTIFFTIVLPLLRPVTGTVAIMTGLIVWNDFFLQLIFLSGSRTQTLPVAIYGFVGEFTARWNMVFAAACVAIVPILGFYLLAQKQLIQGFSGGIKG
jgi:raffinose/stachyose/melibiose transport system permease protein